MPEILTDAYLLFTFVFKQALRAKTKLKIEAIRFAPYPGLPGRQKTSSRMTQLY